MKTRAFALALAAGCATTGVARAQSVDPRCTSGGSGDACQKVVDLMNYMGPQLGMLITGGNATLGLPGTLGGIGRVTFGVRANVTQEGTLPQVGDVPFTPGAAGAPENYPVDDQVIGFPTADVAIGVFDGLPLGLVRVGALDVMANVAYVPDVTENDVTVETSGGSFKFGFGGRLGVLAEGAVWPSVSVSYLVRDLPTTTITGVASGDTAALRDFTVETKAWRAIVGKHFGMLSVSVGYGKDEYELGAEAYYSVETTPITRVRPDPGNPLRIGQSVERSNAFLDLGLDLKMVKLGFEIGQVTGGDIETYNTFSKPADDDRIYGSLGVRVGF